VHVGPGKKIAPLSPQDFRRDAVQFGPKKLTQRLPREHLTPHLDVVPFDASPGLDQVRATPIARRM